MEQEEQPKVSVIIPVYNTEAYVREAVESITRQTLQELEIIIINDGSTDGSLAVIEDLAEHDGRIRVYSQKNQGQSVARNIGIGKATGKYLYFMDSDDVLANEALESCYRLCEENTLDFVFFDADILNKNSTLAMKINYDRGQCMHENTLYEGTRAMQMQLTHRAYSPSPCLSFIRRSFFMDNEMNFYPGIIHEDQLFTSLLYLKAKRTMYIPDAFFKRRFRNDSTMTRRYSGRNIKGYLTLTNKLCIHRKTFDRYKQSVIDLLLTQMLNAAVWQAHVLPLGERISLFFTCLIHYKKYVTAKTLSVLLLKPLLNKTKHK